MRHGLQGACPRIPVCFNPRTPAGCDLSTTAECTISTVSTHAPLRGATYDGECALPSGSGFQPTHPCGVRHKEVKVEDIWTVVSTHAPLRGATRDDPNYDPKIKVSTHAPLRGATLQKKDIPSLCRIVSTHAPLRGATPWQRRDVPQGQGFNPRTPAGCDLLCVYS